MNLRRRTGSHGRGGARLAYRTPIAASLATACLLGSVLGAQPAAAQSIFDRENHAAAASYAVHHLGADPKYGNWESGVNTYTAVGASAANRYARLPADRALPATIANKWTAMADFVTQVTGYNPRIPRDLATLNAAVHDYSFLLDQHAPNFPALKALFDTLEYRQVAVVHGHDELRRRLLFNCARCAREVVIISVLTSAGGLAGLGFNGQSTFEDRQCLCRWRRRVRRRCGAGHPGQPGPLPGRPGRTAESGGPVDHRPDRDRRPGRRGPVRAARDADRATAACRPPTVAADGP